MQPPSRPFRPSLAAPGALLGCWLLGASTFACGGGGGGDPPTQPAVDEYGRCARVAESVGPATSWLEPTNTESLGCKHVPLDRNVCISGVTIVAIDRFDETGKGALGNYYVEDTAEDADYSGVTVYAPSFSPPDLRMAEGDVADMLGVQTEFIGPNTFKFGRCRTLPELSGTMSFRFDGSHVLVPTEIPLSDLKSYETGRKHIGKLVKVKDVLLADAGSNDGKGRFTAAFDVGGGIEQADVPYVSNELYDLEGQGPVLTMGMKLRSITGIVTYFAGYHIAPRSPADFEP